MFTESDTLEQMVLDALATAGAENDVGLCPAKWQYVAATEFRVSSAT
jgi:hypothetical protein